MTKCDFSSFEDGNEYFKKVRTVLIKDGGADEDDAANGAAPKDNLWQKIQKLVFGAKAVASGASHLVPVRGAARRCLVAPGLLLHHRHGCPPADHQPTLLSDC